jgi:uncharacterized membrane protein YedE/YeeE
MSLENMIWPLFGGVLIGLSASLLLLIQGRVFGVSGIIAGVLAPKSGDTAWRLSILAGFAVAGGVLFMLLPSAFNLTFTSSNSPLRYVVAGLLVGFGTQLGSGCTSGHGVCGISRLSPRSIVATMTFIFSGMLMVGALRYFGVIS